jgi:hypothetical protein
VFVPYGWDSWGKIRVLREDFDVEGVCAGWSTVLSKDTEKREEAAPSKSTKIRSQARTPPTIRTPKLIGSQRLKAQQHIPAPIQTSSTFPRNNPSFNNNKPSKRESQRNHRKVPNSQSSRPRDDPHRAVSAAASSAWSASQASISVASKTLLTSSVV